MKTIFFYIATVVAMSRLHCILHKALHINLKLVSMTLACRWNVRCVANATSKGENRCFISLKYHLYWFVRGYQLWNEKEISQDRLRTRKEKIARKEKENTRSCSCERWTAKKDGINCAVRSKLAIRWIRREEFSPLTEPDWKIFQNR